MRHAKQSTNILAALSMLTVVCLACLPSPARAAYTRPLQGQITETPAGPLAVSESSGLATDAAGDLWVGNGSAVSEFDSAAAFVGTFGVDAKNNLAIDGSLVGPDLYVVSGEPAQVEVYDDTGMLLRRFGEELSRPAFVAVDDSSEPSAGDVYVATGGEIVGAPPRIERLSTTGAAVDFTAKVPYVSGNEILGTPTPGAERFETNGPTPGQMAVDSHGDIFVDDHEYQHHAVVLEYAPSGLFVRAITGEEAPGVGGNREDGGWGGLLGGIAFDPISGHVVVAVTRREEVAGFGRKEPVEGAVDEFEAATGKFVGQVSETSDGQHLHGAFGVAADSKGDLYVVDAGLNEASKQFEHAVDVFGPGLFVAGLRLAEPTDTTQRSATLNGSVDPDGRSLGECEFEYVTEAAFRSNVEAHGGKEREGFADLETGGKALCSPSAASISSPANDEYHRVEAAIGALSEGTVYRYRLVATTSGELGGKAVSAALAFTTPARPVVDSVSVSGVSSEYAELHARIDPLGADTSYHFEYDTRPYGEGEAPHGVSVPVPDSSIGSGGANGGAVAGVVQQIGPLAAGTAYYFRAVAENAIGSAAGGPAAEGSFTTLSAPSLGLPDGRAYELVTPLDKGGAADMFAAPESEGGQFVNQDIGWASESGEQFLIKTNAAFGAFPASDQNVYVFSRTPGGWAYTSLAVPALGVQSLQIGAFEPDDFAQVAVNDTAGSPFSVAGRRLTSLVVAPGGGLGGDLYSTVHTDAVVHEGEGEGGNNSESEEDTTIVGGSHDLSHVVLESESHTLAPGATGQDADTTALYEWAGGGECGSAGSTCKLVNVGSEGKLLSRCGAVLGQGHVSGSRHNAVSADGSRVLFTAPDPYAENAEGSGGCWNGKTLNSPQLYMRSAGRTIELSAPAPGAPEGGTGHHFAYYAGASEDDSRVFFLSEGELTKDDEGIHDPELYEWRADGAGGAGGVCAATEGCLTRVSHGESGVAAGDVLTVPAVSADGGAVYFTAFGKLAGDATALTAETDNAPVNLYRYDTTTGTTTYVARVNTNDYPETSLVRWGFGEVAVASNVNWYTTPDGRYLLFATRSELTGYNTAGAGPCPTVGGAPVNGHCYEVYRYDAGAGGAGSLTCLSCDPSGALPVSNALFARSASLVDPSAGPVRAMSDNGEYAYFDTADPLVSSDTNGTLDVYEWHDGKVSLISSGEDAHASFFLGSSPYEYETAKTTRECPHNPGHHCEVVEGGNVFIGTHSNLIPTLDTESQGNVYDARVCEPESPCIKPSQGETAICEGGACQHPPAAPPDPTSTLLAPPAPVSLAPTPAVKPKALSKAQKLADALRTCRKDRAKRKRKSCEVSAQKKYGATKEKKAKKATRAARDRRTSR